MRDRSASRWMGRTEKPFDPEGFGDMTQTRFKLANILLEMNDETRRFPSMMYRASGPVDYSEADDSLAFEDTISFLTYFNGLSCGKWRKYTVADRFRLHVDLMGDPCDLEVIGVLTDEVSLEAAPDPFKIAPDLSAKREAAESASGAMIRFEGASDYTSVDVEVDCDQFVIVGFKLATEGVTAIRNAYWYAEVDEMLIRPIDLALVTTTFKKEQYVVPNIETVKREVLGSDDAIADAFHMYVIDNGRTLDAERISDTGVTVIPNANVGGAGGFARGMIAAIESECVGYGRRYTHVLLMDDDVKVFPESFKRTFNLLSITREEYKDAFINGAMLQAQQPNVQFEDVAHVMKSGAYHRIKGYLCMDVLADVALNEAIDVEVPDAYGAWWYSCIPLSAIEEYGLPLPIFFRCDDVEYGLRCQPTYMTMNGICVWHDMFDDRFRASVDGYQYMRNFSIVMACSGDASLVPHALRAGRMATIFLRNLAYENAELVVAGLEDFLKGPQLIMEPDGESIFKTNNAACEELLPLDEAIDVFLEEHPELEGKLRGFRPNESMLSMDVPLSVTRLMRIVRTFPYDKHLLPDALLSDTPGTAYYGYTSSVPGFDQMAKRVIVACGRDGSRAHVRVMDRERDRSIRKRLAAVTFQFFRNGARIKADYKNAMPEMTSVAFWKDYLKLANEMAETQGA